jgi:hypothetical protein
VNAVSNGSNAQPWRWLAVGVVAGLVGVLGFTMLRGEDAEYVPVADDAPEAPTTAPDAPSGAARPEEPFERLMQSVDGQFDAEVFAAAFAQAPTACELAWPSDVPLIEPLAPNAVRAEMIGPGRAKLFVRDDGEEFPWSVPVVLEDGVWAFDAEPCETLYVLVGATSRASDSAAKSDLRNAFAAAKVVYVDEETYAAVTPEYLADIEPALRYGAIADAAEGTIGIGELTPDRVLLVTKSRSGKYFCIADDVRVGPSFGSADTLDGVDTAAECTDPEWDE